MGGAVALVAGVPGAVREAPSRLPYAAGTPPGLLHAAGAPFGHAGADGQPTCHVCHNDLELNEPEGRLDIVGFPERYESGRSYGVTVLLMSDGMERSGFQATVDAGELMALDGRTVAARDSVGRSYVGHGAGGAMPHSRSRTQWTFEWVAPGSRRGRVVLNVAANSANGDNSPMGDFVYTASGESH